MGKIHEFADAPGFQSCRRHRPKRYDDSIKNVPNKKKIVDDTLLYAYKIEESFFATWDLLILMANNGVVTNANKF